MDKLSLYVILGVMLFPVFKFIFGAITDQVPRGIKTKKNTFPPDIYFRDISQFDQKIEQLRAKLNELKGIQHRPNLARNQNLNELKTKLANGELSNHWKRSKLELEIKELQQEIISDLVNTIEYKQNEIESKKRRDKELEDKKRKYGEDWDDLPF